MAFLLEQKQVKRMYKYKNKAGFSIAELLVAILILSMVSVVVAGGIPVARDAYNKITVAANAQVLLSTTLSSLRSELGTASEFYLDESGSIIYKSGKNGNISKLFCDDNTGIMIQEYYDREKKSRKNTAPSFGAGYG